MKNKLKKLTALVLALVLAAALGAPAAAAHVSADEAIGVLETLGLAKGDGTGFAPERAATRAEALVMLLRLLGRESAARDANGKSHFVDGGGWAERYIAYAWDNGLTKGVDAEHFGTAQTVGVRDYLTMVLRALDYSDTAGDFTWAESIAFADAVGLTHGEYSLDSAFLREDMALVSYTALTLKPKGSELTLIERLYLDGVVSAATLKATRLAGAVFAGKTAYDAAEIYEMSSSAVFYAEFFETKEDFDKNASSSHGSGFFVTEDGVAVMSYHELDGCAYARATTTDGRKFDITGVLHYDPLWDVAVVRVSRTDTAGRAVTRFPYLDIGDPDAVRNGDRVYTVSNPLGLIDCITDGVVSNRSRNVDDPDYLCLQISAPISAGSSGGAVINRFGEVIGIVYASYVSGQNLNLAVPLRCIAGVSFIGNGIPLPQVLENENEKKAAAEITAEKTELELNYGEEIEILVSHTCPGPAVIQYEIMEPGAVECAWGSFVTKRSVPLYITGTGNGESDIQITFADGDGNADALLTLHVTVTGAPEEAE